MNTKYIIKTVYNLPLGCHQWAPMKNITGYFFQLNLPLFCEDNGLQMSEYSTHIILKVLWPCGSSIIAKFVRVFNCFCLAVSTSFSRTFLNLYFLETQEFFYIQFLFSNFPDKKRVLRRRENKSYLFSHYISKVVKLSLIIEHSHTPR